MTRPEGRAKLDVLFLIDATGSMDDEIDRLKESVTAVARRSTTSTSLPTSPPSTTRSPQIQPIASSGLDDQGEYVFRQLAQMTMGRFTFLTSGADGASPGDSTSHHVSDYAVLRLDDLVVRLVSDELGGAAPGGQ